MTTRHRFSRRAALALAAGTAVLAVAGGAMAQSFPTRPITLVVPFPAGGTTDVMARIFAERMGEDLGQRVVVENRGGATGTVAAAHVARSAPDGYTMFISNVSTHAVAPHLFKNLAYDTLTGFAPVSLMTLAPGVFLAHPDLKAKDLKELVALLKANPGTYNYASPGNGTAGHLGMERFRTMTGVDMVHVPFKGSGPARNAVLAGEPKFMVENIQTAIPLVQAGKLKILAVAAEKRSAALPDAPTTVEQGWPDLLVYSWTAFFVPAGTPKAVIDRLNAAALKALNHPDTQSKMKELSTDTVGSTPAELDAFVKKEFETWGEVIRATGLKIDN